MASGSPSSASFLYKEKAFGKLGGCPSKPRSIISAAQNLLCLQPLPAAIK